MSRLRTFLYIVLLQVWTVQAETDPWSFLVVADPHIAETWAKYDSGHPWFDGTYERNLQKIANLKDKYGGDLVVIPGDTQSGTEWFKPEFAKKYFNDENMSPSDSVLKASKSSYETMKRVFQEGGFDKILAALGDHELGGNGWSLNNVKIDAIDAYRQGFQSAFNRDNNDNFLYNIPIGNATSRPIGTPYENTSFAHQHKNVLFITVDCFHNYGYDYFDTTMGVGGEGAVSVTVQGEQLLWFEKVLQEARKNELIKHIIVQAHVPILQPVRRVSSSGQFWDLGADSEFWQIMSSYNVDFFLCGEVHAISSSKLESSNTVQIASRGNMFNALLTFEVSDDVITVKAFNEIIDSDEDINIRDYKQIGELSIDKSAGDFHITKADGALEILTTDEPLLHYEFEEALPLSENQIIGMAEKKRPIMSYQIIDGQNCTESLKNIGGLKDQYDAQVCNLSFVDGRKGLKAAKFRENSRFAILGNGPHAAGNVISFNFFMKTREKNSEMVLVHYGRKWSGASNTRKNSQTLTLKSGNPVLYANHDNSLRPKISLQLNDGKWHHISVSMPKASCLLSEIVMLVDGEKVDTAVVQDTHIFHHTGGALSLGGYGYSAGTADVLPGTTQFIGTMDDFMLHARPIPQREMYKVAKSLFTFEMSKLCGNHERQTSTVLEGKGFKKCKKICKKKKWCRGFQHTKEGKVCELLKSRPTFGEQKVGTTCAICNRD